EGGDGAHAVPAKQGEHIEGGRHVDDDHVDQPRDDGWNEGEDDRERIEGAGVHSSQQWRARVRQRVEKRQMASSDLLAGEHAERKVLNQVVGVDGGVTKEGRNDEEHARDDDEPDEGPAVAAGQGPPPGREHRRLEIGTHGPHATKNKGTVSRQPRRDTVLRYLASTRTRTAASAAIAVSEVRAARTEVADLASQFGFETG